MNLEPIILYVDKIDEEIGFGYTDDIFKVREIISEIKLNVIEDQELILDMTDEGAMGVHSVGNYICIFKISRDEENGYVMLLDCNKRSKEDTEESLGVFLNQSELLPYALAIYRDFGARLLLSLRPVSLSLL